jgi:hypothetical protein
LNWGVGRTTVLPPIRIANWSGAATLEAKTHSYNIKQHCMLE